MKRRVIKQGNNTLTITLPKEWTQKFDIKQGDELEIEEKESVLVINKNHTKTEKEISIKLLKESERYIRSYIGRLYRAGYSKINISYDLPEVITIIKNSVNDLIGADIIDTEINKCTIQVFSMENQGVNFEKDLVKMLITLKCIFEIVKKDLEKDTFDNEKTLNELRYNNWKIKDFILRNALLQNASHETLSNLSHLSFCYEKIGSKLLGFYKRYLNKEKKRKDKQKLYPLLEKVNYFITWLINKLSREKAISIAEETEFRNELLDFNVYLLNELHNDKNIDHAFLTIIYFTTELLDGSISYLEAYKRSYTERSYLTSPLHLQTLLKD